MGGTTNLKVGGGGQFNGRWEVNTVKTQKNKGRGSWPPPPAPMAAPPLVIPTPGLEPVMLNFRARGD